MKAQEILVIRNFSILAFLLISPTICVYAQESVRNEPTVIIESGYNVSSETSRGYKVNVALILSNPFENRFASYPKIQVTLRTDNGAIISSKEIHGAGIPPKQTIALCESVYAEERPTKVDFRPLSASYETTEFKLNEFRQFTLLNLDSRLTDYGDFKITGEVKNPYSKATGVWICFLFRDTSGKLIGGHQQWISELPSGDPFAFQTRISAADVPENLGSIDKMVFSHNNFQSSWKEVLRQHG